MKMDTEQYALLCAERDKMERAYSEDAIREYRDNINFAKVQFHSFIWGMFWKIPSNTRAKIGAGLFDAHIETALKKCWAKYI